MSFEPSRGSLSLGLLFAISHDLAQDMEDEEFEEEEEEEEELEDASLLEL